MAIGIIRNLGGGGTSKEKGLTIYKEGIWGVPYDNAGYYLNSNFTNDGGFTLGTSSMSASASTSGLKNKSIMTNAQIDFSQYSSLEVIANGIQYVFDVTDVTGNYYLIISHSTVNGSNVTNTVYISTAKANYGSYAVGGSTRRIGTSKPLIITKIRLF